MSFFKSISRGFVTDEVFERRQAVCATCRFTAELHGIKYCTSCNCPASPLFALRIKNTLRGWECHNPDQDGTVRRTFEDASKAG